MFPGDQSLKVVDRWVTVASGGGFDRITLTAPSLSAAKKSIFLVSGSSKQKALKRLLDPLEPFDRTPARLVQSESEVLILADENASTSI